MATPGLFTASGRGSGPRLVHSAAEEPVPAMAGLAQTRDPFATDTAGFDYFRTDFHHRHLVAAIREHLTRARGFVLVTGEPAADSDLLARFLTDDKETGYRVAVVRCGPGMVFDDLVRAYSRQLGLRADDDSGRLWALLSHLMLESRNGVTRVLIVDNADALDIRTFDELHRFAKLDDPHLMSVVLLASPSFAQRLDAAPLNFLKPAIVGQVSVQHLHSEEVGAFIRYQLNASVAGDEHAFSSETIGAIAESAKGDPIVVNRLARRAMPRPAAAPEPAPPPAAAAPSPPPAPAPAPTVSAPASAVSARPPAPAAAPPSQPPRVVAAPPPRIVVAPPPPPPAVIAPVAPVALTQPSAAPAAPKQAMPLSADTGDEDPIPDTPLVLPTATPAASERQEPASVQQLRAVTAGKPPAGQAVALAEAERAAPEKPTAPKAVPKSVAPVGERDNGPAIPLIAPTPMLPRARRRQMASGVAAVIYLLAVVLSGAALLYLFDPGLPHEPAPPSAVATIPLPEAAPPAATPEPVASSTPAAGAPAEAPSPAATPQSTAAIQPTARPVPAVPADASSSATRSPTATETPTAAIAPPPPPAPAAEARPSPVAQLPAPAPAKSQPTIAAPADERPNDAEARNAAKVEPAAAAPAQEPVPSAAPAARTAPVAGAAPVPAATSNDRSTAAAAPPPAPAVPPAPAATPAPAAPANESVAALEPQAAATPPPAAARPPAQEVVVLLRRADQLLAEGDIVSARRFFERAAEDGDPTAACGIAKSYDPLYLRQTGVRGVAGDPEKAAKWYRTAAAAGNSEAALRLKRLQMAYPP